MQFLNFFEVLLLKVSKFLNFVFANKEVKQEKKKDNLVTQDRKDIKEEKTMVQSDKI